MSPDFKRTGGLEDAEKTMLSSKVSLKVLLGGNGLLFLGSFFRLLLRRVC